MPKYRVKLGEIHLESNKPITPEERKAAIKEITERYRQIWDGVWIVLTVDRH